MVSDKKSVKASFKYFRLPLLLGLLATGVLIVFALPFFFSSSDFKEIVVTLGDRESVDFVGTITLKNDGTAELVLPDQQRSGFSFDRVAAGRALFRAEKLWSALPDGPGQMVQDDKVVLSYQGGVHSGFLGNSRPLSSGLLLANRWGVGRWFGPEANREDISLTFLSEIFSTVSESERKRLSELVAGHGAPPAYPSWILNPEQTSRAKPANPRSPELVLTPAPWVEKGRASSPDGNVEAVLVERSGPPYGDFDHPDIKQTNVFLVSSGAPVKNLAPFALRDFDRVRDEELERSVYAAFNGSEIELNWIDDGTLRVVEGPASAVVSRKQEMPGPGSDGPYHITYLHATGSE
jgi:hypothetical protein